VADVNADDALELAAVEDEEAVEAPASSSARAVCGQAGVVAKTAISCSLVAIESAQAIAPTASPVSSYTCPDIGAPPSSS